MIYLVTKEQSLFDDTDYQIITAEKSLELMKEWKVVQYDSETSGRNCHLNKILSAQFGNDEFNTRIVVDCTTIDISLYKEILESKLIIGQNLKFDLQFLYNHNIIPRNLYDTMIAEQILFLGYPKGIISYSLNSIAKKYLNINIDKTVRGEIIWRGLDKAVIMYGAGDVTYLQQIAKKQIEEAKQKDLTKAIKLECDFIPAIAYVEWCGIKIDTEKWKAKMKSDQENLNKARKDLNDFLVKNNMTKYYYKDLQGDLFTGFSDEPIFTINWSSSQQVVKIAKELGFNTSVQDKKTGEEKDSVLEKELSTQKGINDEFLKLYFTYQEYDKVVSSFGQSHLDAINPITGRLHTNFWQLGAASGRLSCGGGEDEDLCKFKKLPAHSCKYMNIQQLPSNHETRSCFIPEQGNNFVSCDFSAMEGRLAADIYEDKAMIEDFLYGTKDSHSLFAWMVFRKECEELGCTSPMDIKEKAPQWRKKVKGVEFAYLFGAAAPTISKSANCTVEQAQKYIDDLNAGFSGLHKFCTKGSKFVKENGYIIMCKKTGHKMYWWDWDKWKEIEEEIHNTPGFWEEYKIHHKGTGDSIALTVKNHFQASSKWDRMARNAVTQGSGAVIFKDAATSIFNWIVDNNYFNKIKACAYVHDEWVGEYPSEITEFPKIVEKTMERSASKYCNYVPIPAEASVGDHWIH